MNSSMSSLMCNNYRVTVFYNRYDMKKWQQGRNAEDLQIHIYTVLIIDFDAVGMQSFFYCA